MTNMPAELDGAPQPNRRRIVIALVATAILALVALGGRSAGLFGSNATGGPTAGGPGDMPPMPVDVDSARRGSVVDAVRATGRIEAVQAVELRPDEQGRITGLLFQEGQAV